MLDRVEVQQSTPSFQKLTQKATQKLKLSTSLRWADLLLFTIEVNEKFFSDYPKKRFSKYAQELLEVVKLCPKIDWIEQGRNRSKLVHPFGLFIRELIFHEVDIDFFKETIKEILSAMVAKMPNQDITKILLRSKIWDNEYQLTLIWKRCLRELDLPIDRSQVAKKAAEQNCQAFSAKLILKCDVEAISKFYSHVQSQRKASKRYRTDETLIPSLLKRCKDLQGEVEELKRRRVASDPPAEITTREERVSGTEPKKV